MERDGYFDYLYKCSSFKSNLNAKSIEEVTGSHLNSSFTNINVNELLIENSNMPKIPKNISNFFPYLGTFNITESNLEMIESEDFLELVYLKNLFIANSKIHQLPPYLFVGLYIEDFTLIDSPVDFVHQHTFVGTSTLKDIYFLGNCAPAVTIFGEIHSERNNYNFLEEKEVENSKITKIPLEIGFIKILRENF